MMIMMIVMVEAAPLVPTLTWSYGGRPINDHNPIYCIQITEGAAPVRSIFVLSTSTLPNLFLFFLINKPYSYGWTNNFLCSSWDISTWTWNSAGITENMHCIR